MFFYNKFTARSKKKHNVLLGNSNANSDHDERTDDSVVCVGRIIIYIYIYVYVTTAAGRTRKIRRVRVEVRTNDARHKIKNGK